MSECVNCFDIIKGNQASVACSRCGKAIHKGCASACECGETLCDMCLIEYKMCKTCENKSVVELETIRRSHLELYDKCPYAFKLEVIDLLGHVQTIYTQSGIDLHELFDEYSKHDNGTPEEMYKEFVERYESKYPEDWYTGYATREKMESRYKRNIKGFFALRNTITKPVITEEKIIFSVGENLPNVSITMDRIDEEDGEYVLGDYKTGKVMVGKKFLSDLQAPLYILAVKQHYNKPVKRFDFYYLGEEKVRSFVRLDNDRYVCKVRNKEYIVSLDETIKEVRSRLDKIQKGLFQIKSNQKPYDCKHCQFFEKHCEGADIEVWNQINKSRGY